MPGPPNFSRCSCCAVLPVCAAVKAKGLDAVWAELQHPSPLPDGAWLELRLAPGGIAKAAAHLPGSEVGEHWQRWLGLAGVDGRGVWALVEHDLTLCWVAGWFFMPGRDCCHAVSAGRGFAWHGQGRPSTQGQPRCAVMRSAVGSRHS